MLILLNLEHSVAKCSHRVNIFSRIPIIFQESHPWAGERGKVITLFFLHYSCFCSYFVCSCYLWNIHTFFLIHCEKKRTLQKTRVEEHKDEEAFLLHISFHLYVITDLSVKQNEYFILCFIWNNYRKITYFRHLLRFYWQLQTPLRCENLFEDRPFLISWRISETHQTQLYFFRFWSFPALD